MTYPWMKFRTRDWLDNKELRRCSPVARSVLTDLMCLAHEGTPYGYLTDKVGPLTEAYMAARCMVTSRAFRRAVSELMEHERIQNLGDAWCIQQMVEDEELRSIRAEGGSKSAGNPKLSRLYNHPGFLYLIRRSTDGAIKIGIATDVQNRIYKLKTANRPAMLDVVEVFDVQDMGTVEAELHEMFSHKRVIGEWFSLDPSDINAISTSLKGRSPEVGPVVSRACTRGGSGSGSTTSEKTTTPEKATTTLESAISITAQRIHERHPAVRRCGIGEVQDKLRAIVRKVGSAERVDVLYYIDTQHEAWCATEGWMKDGGEFAKGLDNWLAPTKRRWENNPPDQMLDETQRMIAENWAAMEVNNADQ